MVGRSSSRIPRAKRCSRYSVTFRSGVSEPEHSRITSKYLGGKWEHDALKVRRDSDACRSTTIVHHHAAVFAVGDLRDERRHRFSGQFPTGQTAGLIVGLHLADQLCVAALGLDDRDDARLLAA